MIITVVDDRLGAGRSGIAHRLARSRAHAGRNVLLAINLVLPPSAPVTVAWEVVDLKLGAPVREVRDTDFEAVLLKATGQYHDILINTGLHDTQSSSAALIAADIVIIPLQGYMLAANVRNRLVERINEARCVNPALGLVAVVPNESNESSLNCDLALSVAARLRPSRIVVTDTPIMLDKSQIYTASLPCHWPMTAYERPNCSTTDLYHIVFYELM